MGRLEDMETFLLLADAASISKAAERLGIAKSAVSRRLRELEERLGVGLVRRSTRGLTLTETGRGFYDRCRAILEDVREAEQAVSAAHTALRGTIKLTAPLSFGLRHLAPLLNDFMTQHPQVNIDIDLGDRTVDLIEERIDLAVRVGELSDSRLIARRLAPTRRMACASPEYLRAHGTPQHPSELRGHHGLLSTNLPESVYWQFTDGDGKKLLGRPTTRMRANNGDILVTAAVAGHGICAVPLFISHQAIQAGELVPLLCDYQLRQAAIYAVYPPGRYLSRRVRVLIDFLVASLGDAPSWESAL